MSESVICAESTDLVVTDGADPEANRRLSQPS
jgi:hypothetical protein